MTLLLCGDIMVEKVVEIGMLFDFYGGLLSQRQYRIVELFYLHDLSLAEIGQELDISRQAVYDTLKRAENKLYKYEEVLGLYEKFDAQDRKLDQFLEEIKKIKKIFIEDKSADREKILSLLEDVERQGLSLSRNTRRL